MLVTRTLHKSIIQRRQAPSIGPYFAPSRLLILLLAMGIGQMAPAAATETQLAGYVKSFAILQDKPDLPGSWHRTAQSQNSVRLMWDVFHKNAALQMHYELVPVVASRRTALDNRTLAGASNAWRFSDIAPRLSSGSRHDIFQNLDRFNLQLSMPEGDLTLGRQAITFGASRIISPTDIFLPFDVRTFNKEYRVGVDGLRFQRPIGSLGELDVGYIAGDQARSVNSSAYVQVRVNAGGNDMFGVYARFVDQTLVGAGVQRALGELGFWAEAAHVSGDQDYWRASLGVDHAFGENVFGQIEYHFNGAGTADPEDYAALFTTPAYRSGGIFLLGEHYLMPSLAVTLSALSALNVAAFINLSDHSAFASLSVQRSLSDNLYADLGIYLFTGDSFNGPTASLGSEYGSNPSLLFASLRYYF